MTSTAREMVRLGILLRDLCVPIARLIYLFCDNKYTLHITRNFIFHEHAKYIVFDCDLVREKVPYVLIMPLHIFT